LCGALALVALLAGCAASPPETEFAGTPKVGSQAPEFTLPDAAGKPVRLSELLAGLQRENPGPEKPRWLLLLFYRGYW
jgi:peroxiredoxin